MVNVEELQKVVTKVIRDKESPQEPPSTIPLVTQVQPLIQITIDTSTKVDTFVKIDIVEHRQTVEEEKGTTTEKIGQIDWFEPEAQAQDTSHVIVIDQDKPKEDEQTPKVKDQKTI